MKAELSIVCCSPAGHMEPFLADLADLADRPEKSEGVALEAIMAGRAEDLPPGLRGTLRDRGVTLRFLDPRGDAYTFQDWSGAVAAAQADWILHADRYTHVLSLSHLQYNLDILRASPVDLLHCKTPDAAVPSPENLCGDAILRYVAYTFDLEYLPNKIYSRVLCMKACRELEALALTEDGFNMLLPHLTMSALAKTYCGRGRGVLCLQKPDQFDIDDASRYAEGFYKALAILPDWFARKGASEESRELARYRLSSKLALTLGRVCRDAVDPERTDTARQALLRVFGKKDAVRALLFGTGINAERIAEIYDTIYGDSDEHPCPAYEKTRFSKRAERKAGQ